MAVPECGTKLKEPPWSLEELCRMPHFEATTTVRRPLTEVFDFLSRPANLIELTPPEFNVRLVEGPERLHLGARVVLHARRWGFTQPLVSEVTAFEPDRLIVDEQRHECVTHLVMRDDVLLAFGQHA